MSETDLILEAEKRRKEGLLRRYAHYECLKDQLKALGLGPQAYQRAVRRLAEALGV